MLSVTSRAESLVGAPRLLCAQGSTVRSAPYLLEALGSALVKLAVFSINGYCTPSTARLLGNAAYLPHPKKEDSKGAFAFLLLPLLISWKSHSMQELEGDHRGIHLLCVLPGEHKRRPRQWGLSIRGASCECAYTGAGGEQA